MLRWLLFALDEGSGLFHVLNQVVTVLLPLGSLENGKSIASLQVQSTVRFEQNLGFWLQELTSIYTSHSDVEQSLVCLVAVKLIQVIRDKV